MEDINNNAAMREALKEIERKCNSLDEECAVDPVEIRDIARAALSSPPRNCDRHECKNYTTATKMFEREVPSSCSMFGSEFFCELGKWILSPYKRRK